MNIDELSLLSLQEIQLKFVKKLLSPVEVLRLTLNQIELVNPMINALYEIRRDEAIKEAKASEARYFNGDQHSQFDGLPVTIKDSVNVVGMKWHHGSLIHGDGVSGSVDSPPAERLKRSGAIIIAKSIMPDFGLSASGVSGSHGIVKNPWGLTWNTGGSSAGAGASLATGVGVMSVGSDIAGSVRLPASHCGLASIKPTQGAIAHSPASTIRSAGIMTRRAADLSDWTQLLTGTHDLDRYSFPIFDTEKDQRFNVGAISNFGFGPEVEPAVQDCFNEVRSVLSNIDCKVEDVQTKANFDAYIPIDDSLKLKGWQEYISADPRLREKTPLQLLDWFSEASEWTPSRISAISKGIEQGVEFTLKLFSGVDYLLTPVMPIVNFPVADRGIDPLMPLRHSTFTALFNQSGHPAVTICGGFDKRGLPIGMQLIGKRLDDFRLMKLAAKLEAALDIYGSEKKCWPTEPSV